MNSLQLAGFRNSCKAKVIFYYNYNADSGNSTLRDPNELLDLEGEEDSRRPPPISEEVVTVDSQVNLS